MVNNVLLLTVDSLRPDHLGFFGDQASGTGSINTLANEGVEFRKAYATGPGTTSSFPALLTGTYPLSYKGLGLMSSERPRLSRQLSEQGMSTGAFQSNPFLSQHFNYDIGFDTFNDYQNPLMGYATRLLPRGIEINNPYLKQLNESVDFTGHLKRLYQVVKGKPRPYVSAETIATDTVKWLTSSSEPFFCWTHFMDVHHPCYPPESYRASAGVADVTPSRVSDWYSALVQEPETLTEDELANIQALYDASIEYVDDQIGRIVHQLEMDGRFADTMIIITSDHGELFGEHGVYGKPPRMYEELLHVPLIVVNGPENLAKHSNSLLSLIDIPPFVHDALGITPSSRYEGVSHTDWPREHVLAEHEIEGDAIVGARSEEWIFEVDTYRDEQRLFDCRTDSFERLSEIDSADIDTVRDIVLDRLQSLNVGEFELETEVDGAVKSRLEELGYLE